MLHLRQLLQSRVGHVGIGQVECPQPLERCQSFESFIGHVAASQRHGVQVLQVCHFVEIGAVYSCATHVQRAKLLESGQVFQGGINYLDVAQIQVKQIKLSQVPRSCSRHVGAEEVKGLELLEAR